MSLVLVVEDAATDLEILRRCLQRAGLDVLIARSGEEAFEMVAACRPDLIVTDVVLPGCSGFELCRELKATATSHAIPIVMCSTKSSKMDRFWGLRQGADAYLPKPIDQNELVRTVQQLLSK